MYLLVSAYMRKMTKQVCVSKSVVGLRHCFKTLGFWGSCMRIGVCTFLCRYVGGISYTIINVRLNRRISMV